MNSPSNERAQISGSRLILLKVGLACLSVLLVIGFFEIGLRLAGFEAIYEIYSKPSALWRHDPSFGWHHERNSSDVFVGPRPWPVEFESLVEINSLGLRGPEVPPSNQDDFRILFLGDSMVAAMEVDYDKTFASLVASDLGARFQSSIRPINAGVRGYGTDQSYLYFRDQGRFLEPDLVVFFHSQNDFVNNSTIHRMRRAMGKPAFVIDSQGNLELIGSPVPVYPVCSAYAATEDGRIERRDSIPSRLLCRLQMVLFDRSALFSFITLRVDWNPELLRSLYYLAIPKIEAKESPANSRPPAWHVTVGLLKELKNEVLAAGAELMIVGVENELIEGIGRETLDELGVPVVLIPRPGEDQPLTHFLHDSHYNETGHRRVADFLLPAVERVLSESGRVARNGQAGDASTAAKDRPNTDPRPGPAS